MVPGDNLIAWSGHDGALASDIEQQLRGTFQSFFEAVSGSPHKVPHLPDQPGLFDGLGAVVRGQSLWVHAEVEGAWIQRDDARVPIRGQVIGPDGTGIEGIQVQATTTGGAGWYFPDTTDSDGSFALGTIGDNEYIISFRHRHSCSSYYREDGATDVLDAATRIDTSLNVQPIEFRIGVDACGPRINGIVVDEEGAPVVNHLVQAVQTPFGTEGFDYTGSDGSFSILADEDTDYVLRVIVGDTCEAWYDGDTLTHQRQDASTISVSGSTGAGLDIRLPSDICRWIIRGSLLLEDGTPIPGALVNAVNQDGEDLWPISTSIDGSFTLAVPRPGRYRLAVRTDAGCNGYFSARAFVTELDDALPIHVTDDDAGQVVVRLASPTCNHYLRGRLVGADGFGLQDTEIVAEATDGSKSYADRTGPDGSFALIVQDNASYNMRVEVSESCHVYYEGEGVTTTREEAVPLDVRGADVQNLLVQIPLGPCGWRIGGRLLDANGLPIREKFVLAQRDADGEFDAVTTDSEGTFEFEVPGNGAYRISFWHTDGCTTYYAGQAGTTAVRGAAALVAVQDEDIEGIEILTPREACGGQIRGTVRLHDGSPLIGAYVSAIGQNIDGRHEDWTTDKGTFVITSEADGEYLLLVNVREDCFGYYRDGGFSIRPDTATEVWVVSTAVTRVDVTLPEGACEWQVHGHVESPGGHGVADIVVRVRGRDGRRYSSITSYTAADGAFSATVPGPGRYTVEAHLEYYSATCKSYDSDGEEIVLGPVRQTVEVTTGDVFDVVIVTPELTCGWQIAGRVVDVHGVGLADVPVVAVALNPPEYTFSRRTYRDGRFVIRAETTDEHRLQLKLGDGCFGFLGADGLSRSKGDARPIRVSERNVTGLTILVPDGFCDR